MRYFYRTKENNEILDYTSFSDTDNVPAFILEQYTETDREIVQVTSGKLMFADEVDTEAEAQAQAEQAKQQAISELNNEYNEAKALYREYYTTAIMRNDSELAQSIADDDAALDDEYDSQLAELEV